MRYILGLTLLGVLVLAGCNNLPHNRGTQPAANGARMPSATPTANDLVNYLNDNARRVQCLECRDVDLDCRQGVQPVGALGMMICQKPKNFRMTAKVLGNTEVDLGSNDQEFWYWIGKAQPPYLFHCGHQEFARGNVKMPFPFQPDWIVEALGISEYDSAKQYQVITKPKTFELVEQAVTPQGQQVRKVTVFSRSANQVQVAAHILQDTKGKEICRAEISEVTFDRGTGAAIPKRVRMIWPEQQLEMKMKFDKVMVNPRIEPDRTARLFTRPAMQGVQTYDLARGLDASPTSNPIRKAGGFIR